MVSYFLGENFTDAVQTTNYVNGRLLTAEDLQADQTATLARITQVARAGGYGIVTGLTVKKTADDVLEVSQGLGINKKGVILHLKQESFAFSVRIDPEKKPSGSGRFEDCFADIADTGLQSGAYVLVVRRSVQETGSAPVKSINIRSDASSCASRWIQDGLVFRAVHLPDFPPGSQIARRNRLAHACYGSDVLSYMHRNPFDTIADYGLLYEAGVTDCDLPLAVFYYQNNRIDFVDMWAVRRRVIQPFTPNKWHVVSGDRRKAEGQARFYQFQAQAAEIQTNASIVTSEVKAIDHLPNLPPFGYLPILIPQYLVDLSMQLMQNLLDNYAEYLERLNISVSELMDVISAAVQEEVESENAYEVYTFFGMQSHSARIGIIPDHKAYVLPEQSWYGPTIRMEEAAESATPPVDLLLTRTMYTFYANMLGSGLIQVLFSKIINNSPVNNLELLRNEFVAASRVEDEVMRDESRFNEILMERNAMEFERIINVNQPATGSVNMPADRVTTGSISTSIQNTIRAYFKSQRSIIPPLYCMFVVHTPDTIWLSANEKG